MAIPDKNDKISSVFLPKRFHAIAPVDDHCQWITFLF